MNAVTVIRYGTKCMRNKYNRSPVAAEAERVVLLPGRPARRVVVAVALAETTVLFHASSVQ